MSIRVHSETQSVATTYGQPLEAVAEARPCMSRDIQDALEVQPAQGSFCDQCSDFFSKIWSAIYAFFKSIFSFGSSEAVTPQQPQQPLNLVQVFQETLNALRAGRYTAPNGQVVTFDIAQMQQGTRLYNRIADLALPPLVPNPTTQIHVVNEDSVTEGLRLKREFGYNVAVVNFANEDTPGGGVEHGARAQEEALCRTTGLYYSIDPRLNTHLVFPNGRYKIPEFGSIFSPSVPVLRRPEGDRFQWMDGVETLHFISSAAYHPGNRPQADQARDDGMKQKIRMQVATGILHGCDALVLGAFGCGAFQNPPAVVARLTREVLQEDFCRGAFRHVSFAVYVAPGSARDQNNLQAFQQAFPQPTI
ncbi:MAG: TIGR02452 family protein [Verrucomicrobia bacterium]|nr:TIGR02452 family protein [Verrucomicrobiota bacterium]